MASKVLKVIISGDAKGAIKSFKDVGDAAKGMEAKTSSFGANFAKVGKAAALGVAAVAATAGAIAMKSADTYANVGKEVIKLQRYAGGSAQDMSRLRTAFQLSGVDIDKATKSMGIFSKNVVADKVKQFGINVKDAHGHMLPMHDVLLRVADRMASLPPGFEKSNMAMKLFGKAGMDMLPFLNRGAAGIKELEAMSDKYGTTLSEKDTKAVKESTMNHRLFTLGMQGLQIQIGRYVLPVLTKMVGFLSSNLPTAIKFVRGFIDSVRQKWQEWQPTIQKVIEWLRANILPKVMEFAKRVADTFQKIVTWIQQHWESIKRIVGIGIAFIRKAWEMFGGPILANTRAVWGAISGVIRGALNIISGIVRTVMALIHGDWGKAWNGIKQVLSGVWTAIKAIVVGALNVLKAILSASWAIIRLAASAAWNGIKNLIGAIWNGIKAVISGAINAVKSILSGAWNAIRNTASAAWNGIKRVVSDVISGIERTIRSVIGGITGFLSRTWDAIARGARTGWNAVGAAIKAGINFGIDRINDLLGLVDRVLGFLHLPQPKWHIQRLASGGLISNVGSGFITDGPRAIVGEGNPAHPEYVIPTDPMHRQNALALLSGVAKDLGVQALAAGGKIKPKDRFANGWTPGMDVNTGKLTKDTGIAAAIGNFGADALGWLRKGAVMAMFGPLKAGYDAAVSHIPFEAARGVAKYLGDKAYDWAKGADEAASKQFDKLSLANSGGPPKGGVPGNAAQWINAGMALAGVSGPGWFNGLSTIASRESSFNPHAINLSDSNARAGHPSKGIIQTIDSTFRAYMVPGHGDIWNPIDNIAAGIRYIIARYGGIGNVQQANPNAAPKGYHSGGIFYSGDASGEGWAMLKDGEHILTPSQYSGRSGGSGDTIIHVHVQGSVISERELIDTITKAQRRGYARK